MVGINLQRGAAVQIQAFRGKLDSRSKLGCKSGNQIVGRTGGGREDIAVVGFVEFGAREPEEVTQTKPDWIEFRTWPAGHSLARRNRLFPWSRQLRDVDRHRIWLQRPCDLGDRAERQQTDDSRGCRKAAFQPT